MPWGGGYVRLGPRTLQRRLGYSAKELAEAVDAPVRTIQRLRRMGKLPFVTLGGRTHVFPKEAILALVNAGHHLKL